MSNCTLVQFIINRYGPVSLSLLICKHKNLQFFSSKVQSQSKFCFLGGLAEVVAERTGLCMAKFSESLTDGVQTHVYRNISDSLHPEALPTLRTPFFLK